MRVPHPAMAKQAPIARTAHNNRFMDDRPLGDVAPPSFLSWPSPRVDRGSGASRPFCFAVLCVTSVRPVARAAAWPAAAQRASRARPIAPAVFAAVLRAARTASFDEATAAACMPAWARPSPSAAPPPAIPDAMPGSCVLTKPASRKMTKKRESCECRTRQSSNRRPGPLVRALQDERQTAMTRTCRTDEVHDLPKPALGEAARRIEQIKRDEHWPNGEHNG